MELLLAIVVAWVGVRWLKRLWQVRHAARIASQVNAPDRQVANAGEVLKELHAKASVDVRAGPRLLDSAPAAEKETQHEGELEPEPKSPAPSDHEDDLDYSAFVAAQWRKAVWITPPGNLPAIVDGEECRVASFTPRPGGSIYVNLWPRGERKTFVASHHEWEISGAMIKPAAL